MDKTDAVASDDKYELICAAPKIFPDESAETIRKMKLEIDQLKKGQSLLEKKINDIMTAQNKESAEPASTDTEIKVEENESSDSNPPGTTPATNFESPKDPINTNEDVDSTQRSVTLTKGENGQFGIKCVSDCVNCVIPGSSADLNGIRRGDQLISIDGIRFEYWSRDFKDITPVRRESS